MARKRENLIGRKFGRTTVIDRASDLETWPKGSRWRKLHQRYLCRCDCGVERIVLFNRKGYEQSIVDQIVVHRLQDVA